MTAKKPKPANAPNRNRNSPLHCARCTLKFDGVECVRSRFNYTVQMQRQDRDNGFGTYTDEVGELVYLLGAGELKCKGRICIDCLLDLDASRVRNADVMQDGAYQVPQPDWRPHNQAGTAYVLCPECGEHWIYKASARCKVCENERRREDPTGRGGRKRCGRGANLVYAR